MSSGLLPYIGIYSLGVFLSAISQVLLKKEALKKHKNWLAEYLNPGVIIGYTIFVGCTLLTLLAYQKLPMSMGPILETMGYLYVTIFGVLIFHEHLNKRKVMALLVIIAGIILYAI